MRGDAVGDTGITIISMDIILSLEINGVRGISNTLIWGISSRLIRQGKSFHTILRVMVVVIIDIIMVITEAERKVKND